MCTAVSFTSGDSYFGRNLDFEHDFGEKVTITPRNYKFRFRNGIDIDEHYGIIGMAVAEDNYPLYFDATNEKGLSVAGLNFPDNSHYMKRKEGTDYIASFELIPWILAQCKNVSEAESKLRNMIITDDAFLPHMPPTPLHWIIADKTKSITVEQTSAGLKIYNNPVGVLTNNPVFEIQLFNLNNYMSVSHDEPLNLFSDKLELKKYSRGMGGIGLPGDLSSASRFVRAAFTKLNSVCESSEHSAVNQFFHILYSVYQQRGCVKVGSDYEITNYSSCCNTDKGIYYYTTYNNFTVTAVDMHRENLDGAEIVSYELIKSDNFRFQN